MSDSEAILPLQLEAAVSVAALMSVADLEGLRAAATDLIDRGARAADLREAAYVASLFCGFPKGVSALVLLAEVAPAGWHVDVAPGSRPETRQEGEKLFRGIHRRNAGRQLEMLERAHPPLADTVLTEAYGRVLTRPFLPLATREMAGAISLAVQGLLPQLRAHLMGARNSGAAWDEIEAALRLALALTGIDAEGALAQLAELRERLS